jgi:hypothetical protein
MIWALPRLAGLFFDAMVGQAVHALGRRSPTPRSAPRAGAPWPRAELFQAQPGSPVPQGGPPPDETLQDGTPRDKNLQDDAVQLVSYSIVSIRPCRERALPGGSGQVLVTIPMSGESFVAWIVARYLQTVGAEIEHGEKKYLRVAYEVLYRWPAEPHSGCHQSRLRALTDIRDAIAGLPRWPERAAAPPQPPAPPTRPEPPAPPALPEAPVPAALPEAPATPEAGGEETPEASPPGATKKRKKRKPK